MKCGCLVVMMKGVESLFLDNGSRAALQRALSPASALGIKRHSALQREAHQYEEDVDRADGVPEQSVTKCGVVSEVVQQGRAMHMSKV